MALCTSKFKRIDLRLNVFTTKKNKTKQNIEGQQGTLGGAGYVYHLDCGDESQHLHMSTVIKLCTLSTCGSLYINCIQEKCEKCQ